MFRKNWKIKDNPYYVLVLTLIVVSVLILFNKFTKGKYQIKQIQPFIKIKNIKSIRVILDKKEYIIKDKEIIDKIRTLKCFESEKDIKLNNKNKIIVNSKEFLIGIPRSIVEVTILKNDKITLTYDDNLLEVLEIEK
ncbi:MAG TPA: hypothetical protein VKN74_01600 [Candidatus Mcinerneyibacterium sp.]|nr:hypothetical protein [Candidatus Mcinerneyibacterium sp.]